ncbi:MAG: FAD:protein FMN transferase [Verrucomicrobia bacterium]|nr:FAD:protein FMN transferase [Verrucomicrobiota bacterium]
MATRFEIAMPEDRDPIRLRAAGEEALGEIEGIEARLSLYLPSSEIARVNALASSEPVRVSSEVFDLLRRCARLSDLSQGAFDPTIGPLMRCWGFMRGGGARPDPAALATAREAVGMRWVELDEARSSVRFARAGMMLDLGAVGKGHAIDVAVACLREAGVVNALIHGGTSSVFGLGSQEDGTPWKVAIESPSTSSDGGAGDDRLLAVATLKEQGLAVSAVWGKSFQSGGRELGHVMDPRLGHPVSHTRLAAVSLESSLEADALSTALLALGVDGLNWLGSVRPRARALVLPEFGGPRTIGALSPES